jgi:hypothetical protein
MTLDYDGSFRCHAKSALPLAMGIAGTQRATKTLQRMLADYKEPASLADACRFAARCWAASSLARADQETSSDLDASSEKLEEHLRAQGASGMAEAALLAEKPGSRVCFRKLTGEEIAGFL